MFWETILHCIAQGAGISYVPASFAEDGTSISMAAFNKILSFDERALILEVEAENITRRNLSIFS